MRHLWFLAVLFANVSLGLSIGEKAPDFILGGTDGKDHGLKRSLAAGTGAVVVFVAARCPYSNAYNGRYNELAGELAKRGRGIALLAVNSNDDEPLTEVKRHATDHHFGFPVLKDGSHRVADLYRADRTPEVFFVDAKGVLLYHGRIDDDTEGKHITRRDLLDAIDDYLAGKPVKVRETKAFGCSITRK
jgi:peroxiredoxin